jgi:hypothetical protein
MVFVILFATVVMNVQMDVHLTKLHNENNHINNLFIWVFLCIFALTLKKRYEII